MAIPEYDLDVLPAIEHPYSNEQEVTKRYLGGRAITGQEYATLNIFMVDNDEAKALYEFWRDDCDYGTTAFLAPIPMNGVPFSGGAPNALCEFIEDISTEKIDVHWKQGIKVKVLEYSELLGYIIDDSSNQLVDDSGNSLVSTSTPISNSNKEITYG